MSGIVREEEADLAICDQDLSPAQGRNLERELEVRVIDRTELILDLFATHARTGQAKLQVELARLEYALPRLRRMWTHLDRERGGIGLRGAGEKQIESDRRIIRARIKELKKKLAVIDRRATRRVEGRRDHFNVCLVGYANAGKSSLMNAISGAEVLVADRPFATLDTRTRAIEWGWDIKVLLSDTVGFVRDIPHHLVASFHATLAEAVSADLLLHVVDVSGPRFDREVEVVEGVIASIGAGAIPRLLLLNKVDLLPDHMQLNLARRIFPEALPVSARTGEGLDRVLEALKEGLFRDARRVTLEVPHEQGETIALVRRLAVIHDEEWGPRSVRLDVETGRRSLEILQRRGVRPRDE
jgi:GTP-binding protein HflX